MESWNDEDVNNFKRDDKIGSHMGNQSSATAALSCCWSRHPDIV